MHRRRDRRRCTGYAALRDVNPRLVCAALTGFGLDSPFAERPAYDYVIQAMTGIMELTGDPGAPPTKAGCSAVDNSAGIMAALGLLAKIVEGKGGQVDVAMQDVMLSQLNYLASASPNAGEPMRHYAGSAHPYIVPAQVFQTRDGWLSLFITHDDFWRRFCTEIGRPDWIMDETFATMAARGFHRETVVPAIAAVMAERETAAWVQRLTPVGLVVAGAARCRRVGVTGPPGAGKSSLIARLAPHRLRDDGDLAIIAIDPISPVSGGAILGNRIRMEELATDPRIYIRSLATRTSLDGLADNLPDILAALDRFGFAEVLIETVGVGQVEYAIGGLVDTMVVVLPPGAGDQVQAMKSGILEKGDIYAINKADQPGDPAVGRGAAGRLDVPGRRRRWMGAADRVHLHHRSRQRLRPRRRDRPASSLGEANRPLDHRPQRLADPSCGKPAEPARLRGPERIAARILAVGVAAGLLTDLSGVFWDFSGRGSVVAAQLAIEDFKSNHPGLDVQLQAADHRNKPDVGSAIVRQWIATNNIDAIIDVPNTAIALAINEFARQDNKVLLISGAGSSALTGEQCSPNTIQWTFDTWSLAHALSQPLVAASGVGPLHTGSADTGLRGDTASKREQLPAARLDARPLAKERA